MDPLTWLLVYVMWLNGGVSTEINFEQTNYSPCKSMPAGGTKHVWCSGSGAGAILNAFSRNLPNSGIGILTINDVADMTEQTMDSILQTVVAGSAYTLTEINLSHMPFSRVPRIIKQLTRLKTVRLEYLPNLHFLTEGCIPTTVHGGSVHLTRSNIVAIDSNAFQGDFSKTSILLWNNSLTLLDQQVFLPLLQSMHLASNGRPDLGMVFVDNNPMRCYCYMKWLVRDNRHLLPYVRGASCYEDTQQKWIKLDVWDWQSDGCSSCTVSKATSSIILLAAVISLIVQPTYR